MVKKNTDANTKIRRGLWNGRAVVLSVALALILVGAFITLFPADVAFAGPTDAEKQVDVCGAGADCNSFVTKYINPFIAFLSIVVGIAAVVSIIMAGIQYSASADDPGAVSKAKMRIFNTIIGLVAYIFLLAFFDYLVPGGFF
jgi:hypothetical protein